MILSGCLSDVIERRYRLLESRVPMCLRYEFSTTADQYEMILKLYKNDPNTFYSK